MICYTKRDIVWLSYGFSVYGWVPKGPNFQPPLKLVAEILKQFQSGPQPGVFV